jgi:hypothetical protein
MVLTADVMGSLYILLSAPMNVGLNFIDEVYSGINMSRTIKDSKPTKQEKIKKYKYTALGCGLGGISSEWKRARRKMRRAKVKSALAKNKEIPIFKKCDSWDWW